MRINFLVSRFSFGIVYIALSLLIGECHPFSLVSMYDRFPNYACTYYLTDFNQKLIPLKIHFDYNTNNLTHFHGSAQSKEPSTIVGKSMMRDLLLHIKNKEVIDSLQLHQVCFSLENDSIVETDEIIYEHTEE